MFQRRGVHPPESKLTEDRPIQDISPPETLILHLRQHIGKQSIPIVKTGDKVDAWQKIAECEGGVSAAVHAPAAGTVIAIEDAPHPDGSDELAIIIRTTDGNVPEKKSGKRTDKSADIISIIREAGIVGLGGAMFPTHVKLKIPEGCRIDTVLINAAECEPYLTADSRLIQESTDEVISGIRTIMKAIPARNAIIAIEDNKRSAIGALKNRLKGARDAISLRILPTRYPMGAEKVLIRKVLKRTVPCSGLPLDVGVIVLNAATAFAVFEAVSYGKPLIERIVTVTGDVKNPSNLRVPLGTSYEQLIKECGGSIGMKKKIICGGPMMGLPQTTEKAVTIKGNNGIVIFNDSRTDELYVDKEEPCIRCGRCVEVCPAGLAPATIAKYSKNRRFGFADHHFARDCFECGCCSYVCPSKIDLVGWIRIAKKEICKK